MWQPIETVPSEENVLFGYYGPDEQWNGYYWRGHIFKWEKMPTWLATGGPSSVVPTHWMRVEPPSAD